MGADAGPSVTACPALAQSPRGAATWQPSLTWEPWAPSLPPLPLGPCPWGYSPPASQGPNPVPRAPACGHPSPPGGKQVEQKQKATTTEQHTQKAAFAGSLERTRRKIIELLRSSCCRGRFPRSPPAPVFPGPQAWLRVRPPSSHRFQTEGAPAAGGWREVPLCFCPGRALPEWARGRGFKG